MKTVTKKDVAKRTAKALKEKIYTTEKFVDTIFTVLREILSEADSEIKKIVCNKLPHSCPVAFM